MFGLLNRATSSSSLHRSRPSNESLHSPTSSKLPASPPLSLQPSIDGPPSPEHIRAYTEQMRRGSAFTNRSRSYTSSSATPSFRSGFSETFSSGPGDTSSLSRQSSRRSNASSMPLKNGERPESIQIFGKTLFSRNTRKLRKNSGSRSSSSLSTAPSLVGETQSAKDYYYGTNRESRRGTFSASAPALDDTLKQSISMPYNFQHLTHTRHEQLPNLHRTSRMELMSEFSAIRASQAPTKGELKGIKADDLHFKNFSSEALSPGPTDTDSRPRTSPQRADTNVKTEAVESEALRKLTRTKSHDSLRATPPRPPRSPIPPPPRTSSRTASMLLGNFDPMLTTSLERPEMGSGFRKPKAFHLPTSPPRQITRSDSSEDIVVQQTISAPRTPDMNSWPLPSPFDGLQLADVPEEEDTIVTSRRSRISPAGGELRLSKSVPDFSPSKSARSRDFVVSDERSQTPPLQILQEENDAIGVALSPPRAIAPLNQESWEDDIDYCYEHEAEADCDYDWDRGSSIIDHPGSSSDGTVRSEGRLLKTSSKFKPSSDQRSTSQDIPLSARPSLIFPSPADVPELSPLSNMSIDSAEVGTPGLLRPSHVRSASHASSFKESHGFTLSPSLLIPTDFSTQMDQDALYDELLANDQDPNTALHIQPQYEAYPVSPVDGPSSTASYRSSGYSRASGSGTTLSKTESQESVVLLSRAANVALQHRSMSSSCSLPDLIHSGKSSKRDTQESLVDSALATDVPSLGIHRRKASVGLALGSPTELVESMLSPVAETFPDVPSEPLPVPPSAPVHGRKTSAPVVRSQPEVQAHGRKISAPIPSADSDAPKGRKRAMSAKSRVGSYMLFPQI